MNDNILHVTDSSFEDAVLKSEQAVILDFWAEWCGPCKAISPALEEIAAEMNGQIKIAKINIDDNPNIPGKYGIRSIPTLMIFKDGVVASTQVGAVPKTKIEDWIKAAI